MGPNNTGVSYSERIDLGMKKIAIISFHSADNYGAVLQNYALQKSIQELGHKVLTIDYQCDEINKIYSKPIISGKLRGRVWDLFNTYFWKERRQKFSKFREKYLTLSEECDADSLKNLADCYDVYITGSDQVWNYRIIGSANVDAYGLGFVIQRPRFAYAASAGSGEIDSKKLMDLIKSFDGITVREKSLQTYLGTQNVQSEVVCDPVFLLNKEQWMQLVRPAKRKNYIFLYYLDSNQELARAVAEKAARCNAKQICVASIITRKSCTYRYQAYGDGPLEFLSDIYYSDMVIASSFHATALAIIFEKEFIAIPHKKTGNRVVDLLDSLGLSDRIIQDECDLEKINLLSPIDYKDVRKKMNIMKVKSMNLLRGMCGTSK